VSSYAGCLGTPHANRSRSPDTSLNSRKSLGEKMNGSSHAADSFNLRDARRPHGALGGTQQSSMTAAGSYAGPEFIDISGKAAITEAV
jgi:hypothetical protein